MQTMSNGQGLLAPRRCSMAFQPARRSTLAHSVVVEGSTKSKTMPIYPFVKIAGQEEMKLALLLNVVDPNIGGVLIMGDRGTGKSVAVGHGRACGCSHA